MKGFLGRLIVLCVVFLTLMLVIVLQGMAQDRLLLTGIIRSVDSNSGIIKLNVTSEGCKGIRDFRLPVDGPKDLEATLVGKRIQFYIDSSTCVSGRVYNIVSGGQP